jgi:hypothetical protein
MAAHSLRLFQEVRSMSALRLLCPRCGFHLKTRAPRRPVARPLPLLRHHEKKGTRTFSLHLDHIAG